MNGDIQPKRKNKRQRGESNTSDSIKPKRTGGDGVEGTEKHAKSEVDEVRTIRETEILYNSHLLKLQVNEMTKNIRAKKKDKLDEFLKDLNQFISSLPATEPILITELLSENNQIPFQTELCPTLSGNWNKFQFSPPVSIKLVGSYILGVQLKSSQNVDLVLELPSQCFARKDYLDYRWALKSALYLSHLAQRLREWEPVQSMHYFYFNQNTLRPAILLRTRLYPKADIRLLLQLPKALFKLAKLLPFESSVRHKNLSDPEASSAPYPTPLYNNSLLSTLFYQQHLHAVFSSLEQCAALSESVLLVKIWLRRRHLDSGVGAFTGFLATMLLVQLMRSRQLNSSMSDYQMFRVFIHSLAASNWTEHPVSLVEEGEEPPVHPGSFLPFFNVAVIDTSGYVNLAAELSPSQYSRVKHEAQLCLALLDSPRAFDLLFNASLPFLNKFDCTLRVGGLGSILSQVREKTPIEEVPDLGSQVLYFAINKLIQVLYKGMGERVQLICHSALQFQSWDIDTVPPEVPGDELTLGLLYAGSEAFKSQLTGPSVGDPESAAFSSFWGDKVEIRRFPDGTVSPVVVWLGSTQAESRLIPFLIIRHLLKTHLRVPPHSVTFPGLQLDGLLSLSCYSANKDEFPLSTGEHVTSKIQDSFSELAHVLFALKNLPLRITSVQGTHAVFRGCDPLPPCASPSTKSLSALLPKEGDAPYLSPDPNLSSPRYTPALTAVLNLAVSGKWPDELEAIWRVKTAFYLELHRQLRKQSVLSLPTRFFLDVFFKGFVYRFSISYYREALFMRSYPGPADQVQQMSRASDVLVFETKTLPAYTATVHGLAQDHTSLSPAIRLAKRWVHSEMLSQHIPDITIEMLILYVYLHPEPYSCPGHHATAFFRFLSLLISHDWQALPIILNTAGEITSEEIAEVEEKFSKSRPTFPPLFLMSPWDKESSLTRLSPSLPVLNRLAQLAKQAYTYLSEILSHPTPQSDVKAPFRPPLEDFDVVIRIKLKYVPRAIAAVDPLVVAPGGEREQLRVRRMPVVAFDPVARFVRELRVRYEHLALFFIDELGGRDVGVVWNPAYLQTDSFRVNQCGGRRIGVKGMMEPDIKSILSDFQIIGGDIIENISHK